MEMQFSASLKQARFLFVLFFLLSSFSVFAQNSVTGKVYAGGDTALPNVSVIVKGSNVGTVTDATGSFTIKAPSSGVLVFSYTGFANQEIAVNNQSSLVVQMVRQEGALGEVIVVAYGNTTRKTNTGSIQTLNLKETEDLPVAQITQKLQGKLAGVQINQVSGDPGAGMQIRVRGSASISTGSGPLYVVDGIPIVGDISNLNPDEIETITVLKDAASTSLYGSRAAFGVVIVTTKTAKSGATNVGVNTYTGFQKVPQRGRPDMMNGTEWAQFKKEYYEDLGQPVPEPLQNPAQYGEGYNWYDAMLRTAPLSNYSVSLSTNKDKFSNTVVAGYFKQEGVLLNSDYNRYTIRNNSILRIKDNIRAGFDVAPTYITNNAPATNGLFYGGGGLLNNALLTPPVLNYRNEDGSYPVSVTKDGVTTFPTPNWVRSIQDITSHTNAFRLLTNAYLEYEPVKKLIIRSSVGIDYGQSDYKNFQPSTASRGFASTPSQLNAGLYQNTNKFGSWLSETTASYAKQFGNHSFDVLAGYTTQKFRGDFTAISGYNYTDDRVQTIDAALVKNPSTSDIQQWSLISYIARASYNYKSKYLFGASIRRDGSSRFGVNNRFGNFPSVSLGWVASDESFLRSVKWLSLLKVRGSYGIIGNNNIGNYTQSAIVSTGINTAFGSTTQSGTAITSLGNADLGWEKTKELDLGVDISLFKGRVNITYDYYNKRTSNLLYSLSVPAESGFSSFTGNVGEIKFWGHEFAVTTDNFVGAFKWSTNFNIAFSDNKVLALSGLTDTLFSYLGPAQTITAVGGRIGQFWGLIQEGVYVDQADFDKSPKSVNSEVGTIKFKDINGDGVIKFGSSEGDRTVIGNPFPKFIFGITNNFSYQHFDLSVTASGSYGNKIARMMDEGTTNLDGVFNVLKEVKDRWRSPENPGAGKYGKTTSSTADDRAQFHTRFVQDGSYLTIKNITLGYTVPFANNKTFRSLRPYASVQQAFVFTKYDGVNPEVSNDYNGNSTSSLLQGLDFSSYPVPRTFTLGLNVNFR